MTPDQLADSVLLIVKSAVTAATAPLLERLAASDARVADLKERLAGLETKTSQPTVDLSGALAPLSDRVVVLETKAGAPTAADLLMADLKVRLALLEARPVPQVTPEDVAAVRDRLTQLEVKAQQPPAPDMPAGERQRLEALERATETAQKDIGSLRERVAVVETRQPIPGPAGAPGKDGRDGTDGTGWDDLIVEHDGERTFVVKSLRGERVKEHGRFVLPALIYRGVFTEGKSYEPGDAVTWGGHSWACRKATTLKPDTNGTAKDFWILAVKAGRDGKDGKDAPGALPVVSVGARA